MTTHGWQPDRRVLAAETARKARRDQRRMVIYGRPAGRPDQPDDFVFDLDLFAAGPAPRAARLAGWPDEYQPVAVVTGERTMVQTPDGRWLVEAPGDTGPRPRDVDAAGVLAGGLPGLNVRRIDEPLP